MLRATFFMMPTFERVARASENGVVIVARASAPCRTSALTNSSSRKIIRPSVTRIGEQAGLPSTLRDAWSRSYAVANLFRRIQNFLAEMPGIAPTYKRECNVRRTQTGGIRRSPGDAAVASSRRHPTGRTWVYSAATPVTGFFALCRLRDQSYVVGSTQHSPVTALMRRFARTSRRRCLRIAVRADPADAHYRGRIAVIETQSREPQFAMPDDLP